MSQTVQEKRVHFIGIGGIGMSGLARLLLKRHIQVSGSDLASSYVTEGLIKEGAKVYFGHSSQNISSDMKVVYTSDIKQDNPEFLAAKSLNCALLHRSELLAEMMQGYKTLAVAGTHGKTTTTALLTHVLKEGNLDPSFAVGGLLPKLQINAGHGSGEHFVVEADESDGTFLRYQPWAAIVTNIDLDHLDYYKSEAALLDAFSTFIRKVPDPDRLFWCGDDSRLESLAPEGISYGFGRNNALQASHFRQDGWMSIFDIDFQGRRYKNVELARIGKHNVLNALAVFGLAITLGISEDAIRRAFRSFEGVVRRCEKKGETYGILLIDDYAHHPTEIECTLSGLREAVQERRLIAVYQPHRYSRTRDCLGSFGRIFDDADEVWITDIYGARETPIPGLSSDQVVAEVQQASKTPCRYVPRESLVESLGAYLRPHDVLVSLGAGDITRLGADLLSYFKENPVHRYKIGVIFGGRSLEHAVSLMSAKFMMDSLNPTLYDVASFGITREGCWLQGSAAMQQLEAGVKSEGNLPLPPEILEELSTCDVLFPILHGPMGEDGTIQGFFEMLGKPYVGCDHRSSAVCMDKALTKKLMLLNGIAIIPFVDFSRFEWKRNREKYLKTISEQLTLPLFVKPLHLGSTVGVKKVQSLEGLEAAMEAAFAVDTHILVENGLKVREIEFALMGNGWVTVLPPGEVCTEGKIYDYEGKYGGAKSAPFMPKAELSLELIQEGIFMAQAAYKAAGCSGFARVDFFLDEKDKFWLNEINPIPGCTPTSAYPRICQANGITGQILVDRLITYALESRRRAK
ncbi:MAG: UDP-N-acetylmuramate--L-alanine ligase [Parachlamydia sp.]|nr:UDP-N-acetylmuramate--L-alanine ligase [Parachlamydia sp.]